MSNDNFGLDFNIAGNFGSELQKLAAALERTAKVTDDATDAEKKRAEQAQKSLTILKQLIDEADEIRKAFKEIDSSGGKGFEDQAKQAAELAQKFDEITTRINKIVVAERELAAANNTETKSIAELKAQLKELQSLRENTKDSGERQKLTGQIDALKASLKDAETPIASVAEKLIGLGKNASELGAKTGAAGAPVSQLGGAVSGLGEALASLGPIGVAIIGVTALATAGGVAAKALFDITNQVSELAKQTDELARLVGVTREFAIALQLAAQSAVGTNIVCISCGFRVKIRPQ